MQEHQTSPSISARSGNKPLWIAVGALAVAVAGLGGTLLGTQLPRGAAEPPVSQAAGLVPFDGVPAATPKPATQSAPTPSAAPRVAPAVVRAPAAAAAPVARCDSCGTVVSVTAVQRAGQGSGVGAVAGGVVGGVLGNQVGGGSGRAVATVLGAVGGGWAGNEVEKRARQTTHYAVRVRMDDGSVRTVEQAEAVAVGSPVLVQNGTARARGQVTAWNGS
ncbi:glycine zipper 2TM domain-containing protein [Pseudorhodoferax sp. LjRoot39]|uniref:glycine zipper 2TM domain-containing protein n=1 Tax=Pseudorhodoferax sp. LjRoot39 TaxID=3342328 RepID=UPI003ECF56C9